MARVDNYHLIEATNKADFERQIAEHVATGGVPIGGMSVGYVEGRAMTYHQVVMRDKDAVPVAVVPDPPTNVIATDLGGGRVRVEWTAPTDDGGAPVTSYAVTGSANGLRMLGITASPMETPVDLDVPQTWTVEALNVIGWSAASAPSNEVTPVAVLGTRSSEPVSKPSEPVSEPVVEPTSDHVPTKHGIRRK